MSKGTSSITYPVGGEIEFVCASQSHQRRPSATRISNVSLEDITSTLLKTEQVAAEWLQLVAKVFWKGGSTFDAWLNASSAQIAQVLLTFPYSFAQMGLASGMAFMLLYGLLGCWSSYTMTCLYADYRKLKEMQNVTFEHHTIQWYEVLDGLLGPWWKAAGLIFNGALLFCTATIQLIACGSTVYYISDDLDKRSWTLIFGACCSLSILIPTAHNYRMWSFAGIIMTTYTAWYLALASLSIKREPSVTHHGPVSTEEYFTGATNFLYAFGGHAVTIEIMDAMWEPKKFKSVYVYAIAYVLLILVIPSAVTVYLRFGDKMLINPNAFAVLPKTKFRDAAVILMVIHQFIEFGLLAIPIYIIWEKFLGVHHKQCYIMKVIARVPVILGIWFVALMIPFFGPINSIVGSFLTSSSIYILPCAAHITYYGIGASRSDSAEPHSWIGAYYLNLGTIAWVLIVGVGFGAWASIQNMKKEIDTFGLFAKCYQCDQEP
ncbi:hypothetical protein SELMODRAFT_133400 [Selaginella moellendorffii]|uniref:Amino acid transporter transmembrane domain-containing protein n=1 Tax=Selaginella moellendorffii TaxID=88036 RepID=D8T754_SELML|nr:auxin transporter-like protein 3 [Selaginella moellendorffii]EFJ07500.1 hypothetical protein SELMODRAFT_133400 [Selaginella moellendorffii]|eukprot:XP_002991388.1 auxin transporter-like protein 3 [Selaginella moellendorffii]